MIEVATCPDCDIDLVESDYADGILVCPQCEDEFTP